ncbi:MAG: asparaginase domain-containing protein, partial [Alphaproteobacteria bacterium]
MTEEQPRIAVIGTGGTISYLGRDGLDIVRYVETGKIYEVDELLNAFPETLEQADVVPVRLRAMPSTMIGPAEWLEIAAKIHELADRDPKIAGIVVTHGTATLEETAYFL